MASFIPSIVLSDDVLALDRNSDEWRNLTAKVRQACETSGCFVVDYARIPLELHESFFTNARDMFDVPMEKKLKCLKPSPLDGGYVPSNPFVPLYESFGLYSDGMVREVEKLMWPEGKPGFSEAMNSMYDKMLELGKLVLWMVLDSYGIGDYYESKEVEKNITGNLRTMKYRVPKENEEPLAFNKHVDASLITVLCQNSVQGLQALPKDGEEWFDLNYPKGHLLVVVGDAFQVWSNGRMDALKHRVTMNGDRERYSCGLFVLPKEGVTIEVPEKLVDNEHPLKYKPFVFSEYLTKYLTDMRTDVIDDHAGIRSKESLV